MTLTMKRVALGLGLLPVAALVVALLVGGKPQPAVAAGDDTQPTAKPADSQPKDPATQETPSLFNDDTGELIPGAIPGAVSIPMPTGPELVLVPADSNKARAEQVEWLYIPTFRLDEVKYDAERKLLTGRIDPRLSAETRERVTDELRKQTGAPAQTAFRLNPVRLQAITVELSLPENKKLVLREERSGHDITCGPVSILYRVRDDETHDLLSSNLKDLSLTVRTTHPYSAIVRNTAAVEWSMTAARVAFEKVVPNMKLDDLVKHPLICDHDSVLRLQQSLREGLRLQYDGAPAKLTALMPALDKALAGIVVSDVPLHQLTDEVINSCLIWDSKTARLGLSPGQRETMTRAFTESEEVKTSFKHIWDTAKETLRKGDTAESWHNTLHEEFKLKGKVSAIELFSASMTLEKRFDQSSEGAKRASTEAFDKIKNSGEKWEEAFSKRYREFKGEDWAKSTAGKILNLQRVTNLNTASFRSAIVEVVERMGKDMKERVTLVSLNPHDARHRDTLAELVKAREQNRQDHDRFEHELSVRENRVGLETKLNQLTAEREAMWKKIDELSTKTATELQAVADRPARMATNLEVAVRHTLWPAHVEGARGFYEMAQVVWGLKFGKFNAQEAINSWLDDKHESGGTRRQFIQGEQAKASAAAAQTNADRDALTAAFASASKKADAIRAQTALLRKCETDIAATRGEIEALNRKK